MEPPTTPDPKAAAKEKGDARVALERGKVEANRSRRASAASVALDATDGEAWLILGAAYQQQGNMKDARRCYKACLDQGKRGPRNECSAMLPVKGADSKGEQIDGQRVDERVPAVDATV